MSYEGDDLSLLRDSTVRLENLGSSLTKLVVRINLMLSARPDELWSIVNPISSAVQNTNVMMEASDVCLVVWEVMNDKIDLSHSHWETVLVLYWRMKLYTMEEYRDGVESKTGYEIDLSRYLRTTVSSGSYNWFSAWSRTEVESFHSHIGFITQYWHLSSISHLKDR